jgi:ABC-type uncharacterized transport system permease subunit
MNAITVLNGKLKNYLEKLLFPCVALFCALVFGFFLIQWMGENPWKAYNSMFTGAFGGAANFAETMVYVTPLILTGLSITVGNRCGLFNIGAEGQYIVGMMAAAWVGAIDLGLPGWMHLLLTMFSGAFAGLLWGAAPGFFKAKFGAHEVITTIMTNYIALHLTGYLVNKVLIAPPGNSPVTRVIHESAKLTRFLPTSRLSNGVFVALIALFLVYFFLWKTKWGYEIRAVGLNKEAAEYAGISVTKNIVLAMAISGALAGLAGSLQIQGIQYCFNDLFGFPGYGLDGIAVALLGNNHPAGVFLAALLFGSMNSGALQMQSTAGVPSDLIGVIQAVIIFFIAADTLVRRLHLSEMISATTAAVENAVAGKGVSKNGR